MYFGFLFIWVVEIYFFRLNFILKLRMEKIIMVVKIDVKLLVKDIKMVFC